MSIEAAEGLLRRVGFEHGPMHMWATPYETSYKTYLTQVQVSGVVAWCYVQIWERDLPDVYLCAFPVHKGEGATSRNVLLNNKVWSWQSILEEEDPPCIDEQELFCLLLGAML